MRPSGSLLLLLLVIPGVMQAQTLDAYTKLLVPVYTFPWQDVGGAHGSVWRTTLSVHNDSDDFIDAFPFEPTCASSSSCHQTMSRGIWPRSTRFVGNPPSARLAALGSGRVNGGFLYVERDRVDDLAISLTFEDVSRSPRAIVSLPVAGEDDFFDGTRSIVSVPLDDSSRTAVRIYDDGTTPGATIRLRIYVMMFRPSPDPDPLRYTRPIVEAELTFQTQQNSCGFVYGCPPAQYQPNFIVIGDVGRRFPELFDAPLDPYGIRIEFVPQTAGLRFWPMVTVTDNATSHTTVYTVR